MLNYVLYVLIPLSNNRHSSVDEIASLASAEHLQNNSQQLLILTRRGYTLLVVKLLVHLVFRLVSAFFNQDSNAKPSW